MNHFVLNVDLGAGVFIASGAVSAHCHQDTADRPGRRQQEAETAATGGP